MAVEFYTQLEVNELTRDQCQLAIARLDRKYRLEKTIKIYTDEIDQVVNQLLMLESRIEDIENREIMAKALAARWAENN